MLSDATFYTIIGAGAIISLVAVISLLVLGLRKRSTPLEALNKNLSLFRVELQQGKYTLKAKQVFTTEYTACVTDGWENSKQNQFALEIYLKSLMDENGPYHRLGAALKNDKRRIMKSQVFASQDKEQKNKWLIGQLNDLEREIKQNVCQHDPSKPYDNGSYLGVSDFEVRSQPPREVDRTDMLPDGVTDLTGGDSDSEFSPATDEQKNPTSSGDFAFQELIACQDQDFLISLRLDKSVQWATEFVPKICAEFEIICQQEPENLWSLLCGLSKSYNNYDDLYMFLYGVHQTAQKYPAADSHLSENTHTDPLAYITWVQHPKEAIKHNGRMIFTGVEHNKEVENLIFKLYEKFNKVFTGDGQSSGPQQLTLPEFLESIFKQPFAKQSDGVSTSDAGVKQAGVLSYEQSFAKSIVDQFLKQYHSPSALLMNADLLQKLAGLCHQLSDALNAENFADRGTIFKHVNTFLAGHESSGPVTNPRDAIHEFQQGFQLLGDSYIESFNTAGLYLGELVAKAAQMHFQELQNQLEQRSKILEQRSKMFCADMKHSAGGKVFV